MVQRSNKGVSQDTYQINHNNDDGELRSGVLQLRYIGDDGSLTELNAAELADALQGIVELTSLLAKRGMFGDGPPPEVLARPPKSGSFIVETIIEILNNDIARESLVSSASSGLTMAIGAGVKRLRGTGVKSTTRLEGHLVEVEWNDGSFDRMPESTWTALSDMKRPTKRAFRKILTPLSDEATDLQIRSGSVDESTEEIEESPAEVTATRRDYREAAAEDDDTREETETFEAEAQFVNVDFEDNNRWRIKTLHGERNVTIEDDEFLRRIDHNAPVRKDDIYDVEIREDRTRRNGRWSTTWTLERVTLKRRGGGDDSGSNSTGTDP